jgi:trehalose 6-phosphate phosphatase
MEQAISKLNSALKRFDLFSKNYKGKLPFLALDYDGTISEIVENPDDAIPAEGVIELLEQLSFLIPVAIISGRGLDNLRSKLNCNNIFYAGSHGFEVLAPDGKMYFPGKGMKFLEALQNVQGQLKTALRDITGAVVEVKKFAIAVHYRNCSEKDKTILINKSSEILNLFPELKVDHGKQVLDIKPNTPWHKGASLEFIYSMIENKEIFFPLFIGDDMTDEDAFKVMPHLNGIGIIVKGREGKTAAMLSLQSIDEVKVFLGKISEMVKINRDETDKKWETMKSRLSTT